MFHAECTNTQNPTSFPLLHFLPAFHYPPALAAPPSLGRVHYRPGQQRQARMPTCPMPRIGSFSKYFPPKGEKLLRGRKLERWKVLQDVEETVWGGRKAGFSVMETVGQALPSQPTTSLSPLSCWRHFGKRVARQEQRRVFHVSCVSRAAPGKPRISASVPPGPPGCKERTVHGWNPAERHNGIPAPCIPPIQWTHCTVVYMLFNARSAQYRHTILWKYSTRSRQQQSSIEFTALCISPHFRFCWNAWNDFAEHLWEQITAEPLKCCYFDFSKTLGRLHRTVILSRPTLSSVHCLPDVLAPTWFFL